MLKLLRKLSLRLLIHFLVSLKTREKSSLLLRICNYRGILKHNDAKEWQRMLKHSWRRTLMHVNVFPPFSRVDWHDYGTIMWFHQNCFEDISGEEELLTILSLKETDTLKWILLKPVMFIWHSLRPRSLKLDDLLLLVRILNKAHNFCLCLIQASWKLKDTHWLMRI